MFREAMQSETELGRQVKAYVERGELVPDSLTVALVEQRLSQPDARDGFILDGFPRTVPQAEALRDTLAAAGKPLRRGGVHRRAAGGGDSPHFRAPICGQCGATYRAGAPEVAARPVLDVRRAVGAAARRHARRRPVVVCKCIWSRRIRWWTFTGLEENWSRWTAGAGHSRRVGRHPRRLGPVRPRRAGGRRALIIFKSEPEIAAMRKAGRVVAQAHEIVRERLRPGVTTADIDRWVEEFFRRARRRVRVQRIPRISGACTCTSVNDEVVHGIPGPTGAAGRRHHRGGHRCVRRRLLRRLGVDVPGRVRCRSWRRSCCE